MSYYFPHDYDALNDDKLLQVRGEFGLEGYALFWMCLETMAKNEDGRLKASLIGGLSLGYGVDKAKLQAFLKYCVELGLYESDKQGYFSKRMNEHKEQFNLFKVSGKKGAEKRWKNRETNSPPITFPISPPYSNKRKEDNIKEYNSITRIKNLSSSVIPGMCCDCIEMHRDDQPHNIKK